MKKIFVLGAILLLVLSSCEQPTNDSTKLPTLTIRNQSSLVLTDVKFSDITFAASGSSDLPVSGQVSKQLTANDVGKPFYINFTVKDKGISCRTVDAITITEDYTFDFYDDRLVEEQGNPSNRKALNQITHLVNMSLEHSGRNVIRNDNVNFGETLINNTSSNVFTIKNNGQATVSLTGSAPVKIAGVDNVFTVVQPTSSDIAPNASLTFTIRFSPVASTPQTYNDTVTISSNDQSGDFSFNISASSVRGVAVLELSQDDVSIPNNSITPFDFGNVDLGTNKQLTFTIKNTGTISLGLLGEPIVEVETSSSAFTVTRQPLSTNIAPSEFTQFNIRYMPTAEQEDHETITIVNDGNVQIFTFFVKGTGYVKRSQILISQDEKLIEQYGDFDFGSILISNTKDIVFTIENIGEADLTLDATPSSRVNLEGNTSGYFSVYQQPITGTVYPGMSTTFTIRFAPSAVGNVSTDVRVVSNSLTNAEFVFRIRANGSNEYQIGDTGPGGGMIFFAQGGQFKEVSGELGTYNWSDANTTANAYQGGGCTDWGLPDRGELDLMYQNLHRNGMGEFQNTTYWSSTRDSYDDPYYVSFYNGTASAPTNSATGIHRVRAVRSFTLN